jgi:hypothetical protein
MASQGIVPTGDLRGTFEALLKQFRKNNDTRWEMVLKSLLDASVPGTTTGFQPFNLDMVGKLLLPLLTPMQNAGLYAVKAGETGDSREYRAIVAKNLSKSSGIAVPATAALSVTQSAVGRGTLIDYQYLIKKKFFMKIAPEAAITWELYRSSGPFNALGKTTIASLITAKELEERHILGAVSTALGTTGTPTGVPSNTGGVLTNAASPYVVNCIALNYYGWWYYAQDGLGNVTVDLTNTGGQIPTQAIGTASAGITIASGSTGSIAMTVPFKQGAFAYLWTIKHSGGTFSLAAVTTIPTVTITAEGTVAASTLSTVDGSTLDIQGNTVVWDGLFAQTVLDADIPGQYTNVAGGNFTTTGSGSGVSQVETMLATFARLWHLSPTHAIMSPQTLAALSNVAIGSGAPAYRLIVETGGDGQVKAGTVLSHIRNQFMQTLIEVLVEPIMPDGKVILYTKDIDYPDAGVNTNLELHCTDHFLQDFYARITDIAPPGPWSIKTFGAPTLYWPRACGVIDNVAVGGSTG